MKTKKIIATLLCLVLVWSVVAVGCSAGKPHLHKLKNNSWSYNEKTDVFYQNQLAYCKNPTDTEYQTLSIFVPHEYFNAVRKGDRYQCQVNELAVSGQYTYKTAPIVLDITANGYNSSNGPTDYINQAIVYTQRGYIYVVAGYRGAQEGAPYGVADLKAAVKYLRYIDQDCPGDAEKIYAMGVGASGGLAAVLGASGDSPMYEKYLSKIGALKKYSDAVYGVMCWNPSTSFDTADAAYEWNMGSTRSKLTKEQTTISTQLADKYVEYINALGLADGDTQLTIDSKNGGTYPAYIKATIEESLTTFLQNTRFPYTAKAIHDGTYTTDSESNKEWTPDDKTLPELSVDDENNNAPSGDGIIRQESASALNIVGTYDTPEEYVAALNSNKKWVKYDSKSKKATITSIDDFVSQMKGVTRALSPFDHLDKTQAENTLFSIKGEPKHFDAILGEIMQDDKEYGDDFAKDLQAKDKMGNDTATRVNMYNPLYYINSYYDGNGTTKVAKEWRIRSGINQGDTSLCTEVNLALALSQAGCNVDFLELWGLGNEKYELGSFGDSSEQNTLDWMDANSQA